MKIISTSRIGYYGRGPRSTRLKSIRAWRITWKKPVKAHEGGLSFSLVSTLNLNLMKKHVYQVNVSAAGIKISRYTEFTTVAKDASSAERKVKKHVRRLTKESIRVTSVREVEGEFVG